MTTRGYLGAGIAVLMASLLAAPVAMAGKPIRERLGPYEPFLDPPGVACPEAIAPEGIRWTYAGGNATSRSYDSGRVLNTGRHPDLVTNVATGKSVLLELQGSAEGAPHEDGSVEWRLSGAAAYTFFAGDVGPGDQDTGRIYVFHGRVRVLTDPWWVGTAFQSSGTMQDVCALLA